jgi:hypothetical protein
VLVWPPQALSIATAAQMPNAQRLKPKIVICLCSSLCERHAAQATLRLSSA